MKPYPVNSPQTPAGKKALWRDLYDASEQGDLETVKRVIARGVDVNKCDKVR